MEDQRTIKSIKRINKDLRELQLNPLKGISVCMPDENDPFILRSNIIILNGIYKSMMLHLIIDMPQNYPLTAPNITIAPGQAFDNRFHHHVFGDIVNGYQICIDLLNSGYFDEGATTGWTPAYTLSTLLMQMQLFFSEHDLHDLPSEKSLQELRNQLMKFETEISLTDGDYVKHSHSSPFPFVEADIEDLEEKEGKKEKKIKEENKKEDDEEKQYCNKEKNEEEERRAKVYEKFQCSITKETLNESNFFVGYPVSICDNLGLKTYHFLPEVISRDANAMQVEENKLRTAMGEYYKFFFPIYFKESFTRFKEDILILLESFKTVPTDKSSEEMELGFFPRFTEILSSFFIEYQLKTLKITQKNIEIMTHVARLMMAVIDTMPAGFLEKINDKKILIYSHSDNLIETVLCQIIMKNFLDIPKEALAGLVENLMYEDLNNYFAKHMEKEILNEEISFEHSNELYQTLLHRYNTIIFAIFFSTRFLADPKAFKDAIDSNFGTLQETELENFLLEFVQTTAKITSFSQFFNYLNLPISNDINLFYRVAFFKNLLANTFDNLFKKSCFLDNVPWFLQLLQAYLDSQPQNKKVFNVLKTDLFLAYEVQRILSNNSLGKNEKKENLSKIILENDAKDMVQYEKFLGSQEFIYYLTYLREDKEYGENSKAFLENFNIHKVMAAPDSIKVEEKIWQSFYFIVQREIKKMAENIKKKPHAQLRNLCFYFRAFEKNRTVFKKMKPLFEPEVEREKLKRFLIDNILLNFNEYKQKIKEGTKKKKLSYDLKEVDLMILLICEDFKLLKNQETYQKCLEMRIFEHIFQDSREGIMKVMDENDLLLPDQFGDKIFECFSENKTIHSLDQILRKVFKLKTFEESNKLQLELLARVEEKLNIKKGSYDNNFFDKLQKYALEQSKSFLFVKKIDLISKYLKAIPPYKFIYTIFQDIIGKPLEIIAKYSINNTRNENLNVILAEMFEYIYYAGEFIKVNKELKSEVFDYIKILEDNENIEENDLLSFLFYLKIAGEFENYGTNTKKIFRKFLKSQISIVWEFRNKQSEIYDLCEIEHFFKIENITAQMKKYRKEININCFRFLVFWSLNIKKITEKEDISIWENEVRNRNQATGFGLKEVKNMMEIDAELDGLLEDICIEILKKILGNFSLSRGQSSEIALSREPSKNDNPLAWSRE